MHNSLETGGFRKTIDTVIRLTDTSCIDSAGWNLLIFDNNNNNNDSAGFQDFVLKLSKQKAEVLSHANIDMETIHLDVLHSRFHFFF